MSEIQIRTANVDINHIVDGLYEQLRIEVKASKAVSNTYDELFNFTFHDGEKIKFALDVLRSCKLLTAQECISMQDAVNDVIKEERANFIKLNGGKEDGN